MVTLYDGKGKDILINGGGATTAVSGNKIYDKVVEPSKVINLLDRSKSTTGKMQVPPDVNSYVNGVEVSDYIKVMANNTYIVQVWDEQGRLGNDLIAEYDTEKNFLGIAECFLDIKDNIHFIKYTPAEDGYIRYQYSVHTSDTLADINPMCFLGSDYTTQFVAYTGEDIDTSRFHNTINSEFRNIILRENIQNNLYGKTVYFFGDSNANNWGGSSQKLDFEKKFGCKVCSYGTYGATWSSSSDGVNSTGLSSACGQWNKLLTDVGIDNNTYLFPKESAFFFMMGTNSGPLGEMPTGGVKDITDESGTTDISAMNYILKRVRYYGRNNPIGVFIPWESTGPKRDALIKICDYYAIPYFDITTFVPPYTHTKGLVRPDGTTVENDYFTDGGVHLSVYGWEKFRRVAENWMAYQV